MIYCNINLRNPWSKRYWSMIKCWHFDITKNKSTSIEISRDTNVFRFEFEYTIRQDHAGLNVEFALFGYQISFGIHDNRHWDNDNGRWKQYYETA